MAASVNERLQSEAVHHAVDLIHYSNATVQRMIALLNRTDSELAAKLTEALDQMPQRDWSVQRLEGLLQSVRLLNRAAYSVVERELTAELQKLATEEAGYQLELFRATVPAQVQATVSVAAVDAGQVAAAALARPFQGVVLREALAGLEAGRAKMIRDEIRKGYVAQESIPEIVRRLRGTRAKSYADGLWQRSRNDVEAVVRTAVSHTAGVARDAFYSRNTDLIKALQWVSTLDARTTLEFCVPRDGKQYTPDTHKPIGHKFKWGAGPGRIHWCCRSTSVPITKSWRELGVPMDDLKPTDRASMDGAVHADLAYGSWLAKQSASRQDEVLGTTRALLFRKGGLNIEAFSNDKGRLLTLDQLRERNSAAFKRAGL